MNRQINFIQGPNRYRTSVWTLMGTTNQVHTLYELLCSHITWSTCYGQTSQDHVLYDLLWNISFKFKHFTICSTLVHLSPYITRTAMEGQIDIYCTNPYDTYQRRPYSVRIVWTLPLNFVHQSICYTPPNQDHIFYKLLSDLPVKFTHFRNCCGLEHLFVHHMSY